MKFVRWGLFVTSLAAANTTFAQNTQCTINETLFQNTQYSYTGGCVNGRAHGQGTAVTSNNEPVRYQGQFRNGRFHGTGKLSARNAFEAGQYQNGKLTGSCKIKYGNGNAYSGNCRLVEFHGHGQFTTAGGALYIGGYNMGKRHGKGKTTIKNGTSYQGTFQNDDVTGYGSYRFPDGETYTGQVLKGKYNGTGIEKKSDGRVYQGQFRNNTWHGKGTLTLANGKRYSGVWTNGKATGGDILKLLNKPRPRAQAPRTYVPRPMASGGVVESQIEGEFTGWEGETIFKLTNGQIWQQSSYAYTYHYAYRPEVLIYPSSGRYKMQVKGVDSTIFVNRLK